MLVWSFLYVLSKITGKGRIIQIQIFFYISLQNCREKSQKKSQEFHLLIHEKFAVLMALLFVCNFLLGQEKIDELRVRGGG